MNYCVGRDEPSGSVTVNYVERFSTYRHYHEIGHICFQRVIRNQVDNAAGSRENACERVQFPAGAPPCLHLCSRTASSVPCTRG